MKKRFGLTSLPRFITFACIFFLFGCEESGYNMAEPYVISGTVSTGDPVSGTVHLRTNKRWDYYTSEIKSGGTYELSIWKHDPPYLIWAEIDSGSTLLYSYSSGSRHMEPESNEEPDGDDTVEV